ncbi:hypothetical protein B5G16_09080 [Alistipes sp. An66]|nr:hypothetical protein B5G16_09080 [Alistipes sp. An66]
MGIFTDYLLLDMNILITSTTPFHPYRGGVGRVTDSLTREFIKLGYSVYYIHLSWYMEDRKEFAYPAPVTILPTQNIHDPQNIRFYHDFLLSHKIDIIINQDGLFESSHLFLNTGDIPIKKISVIHNNPVLNYNNLWIDICRLKNQSVLEKIKRIIRCSLFFRIKRQMKSRLRSHYCYIESNSDKIVLLSTEFLHSMEFLKLKCPNKVCCIPNPNTYSNIKYKGSLGKEVIYVGRLSVVKRIDRILWVWNKLYRDFPDWKLSIVGDGPESTSLKEKAKQLGLERVDFCGFQDPRSFYERASIICMTSIYEGWGMVLTEAMQFGCIPVVYNSFESVVDIVKPGVTGELVTPFNQKEFESKMRRLMSDSSYLNQLSANAFQYVKKYDVSNIINQWIKLFNE